MRPQRLELEGFGAFRAPTVVDFADVELLALVGATGAGKSTLIDAITFALYGSVARYDDRKAVAPVINQLSTRARVRLDFELGDETYTVVRVVQRTARGASTKDAVLEHGGARLADDAKAVTAEITRLLGLDVDQFNRTVVLPQGRFADFLHANPADRQATLRQLLGFDVYRRIAVAARQRAAVARNQVDALRPDLDAASVELTDERRDRLVDRHDELAVARTAFIDGCAGIAMLDEELATIGQHLAEATADLALLAAVRAPEGLARLDDQFEAAEADVASSTERLATSQRRRRLADEQVATGPDLTTCRLHLRLYEQSAAAATEHAAAAKDLTAVEGRRSTLVALAETVAATQQALDDAARAAVAAERAARAAVDEGPDPTRVEHWITLRERWTAAEQAVDAAAGAAAAARDALAPAAAALAEAEAEAAAQRARRDELQQRVGVAGFAHLVTAGQPCPLCLQDVHDLPVHDADTHLAGAVAALAAATRHADDSLQRVRQVERRAAELTAEEAAARRDRAALEAELRVVPDADALRQQQARASQLRTELTAATGARSVAESAAAAHRADEDNARAIGAAEAAEAEAGRARAVEAAQRARLDGLSAELADVPPAADVEQALETAERLVVEQRAAVAELHDAELTHRTTVEARDALAGAAASARTGLAATRDGLGRLGPPPLLGERVAAEWAALVAWSATRSDELTTAQAAHQRSYDSAAERRSAADTRLRAEAAAVLADADDALGALRDRLTRAEEAASREVAEFDDRRARTAALRARVDALAAERQVADELGRLLRADGFEGWLMEAALDELADGATTRLLELSSGQFSLEVVERELMVRDHANADELRSARTLSGGETFLASLSLSLALADATTELSSAGAPQIESIFLDEGFGTLDPATLDVVATTIEELGSAGRMVAVVTHLRELADRMPVRLEVTRGSGTSSVERVEV